jgi:hypothetical protein
VRAKSKNERHRKTDGLTDIANGDNSKKSLRIKHIEHKTCPFSITVFSELKTVLLMKYIPTVFEEGKQKNQFNFFVPVF